MEVINIMAMIFFGTSILLGLYLICHFLFTIREDMRKSNQMLGELLSKPITQVIKDAVKPVTGELRVFRRNDETEAKIEMKLQGEE